MAKKFVKMKTLLRAQMLTISRYLIDNHMIFSKLILAKITQKDNSWVK